MFLHLSGPVGRFLFGEMVLLVELVRLTSPHGRVFSAKWSAFSWTPLDEKARQTVRLDETTLQMVTLDGETQSICITQVMKLNRSRETNNQVSDSIAIAQKEC